MSASDEAVRAAIGTRKWALELLAETNAGNAVIEGDKGSVFVERNIAAAAIIAAISAYRAHTLAGAEEVENMLLARAKHHSSTPLTVRIMTDAADLILAQRKEIASWKNACEVAERDAGAAKDRAEEHATRRVQIEQDRQYLEDEILRLNAAQRERIEELKTALKPFSEEAVKWKNIRNEAMRPICARPDPEEYGDADDAAFTVADLRHARAALEGKK